ncbi:peroxidase 63-like [Pyrus ussuriensis x Pyrus communis]|uniref:Peroxidase 63-like n=1 Tax=Pyrus ussuriensis x Pyrus communis TaxID=2448454 RepID=A0A5N5FQ80_9ROSA|nr:peroxidase 63-like [Pyrus ussuriensis x Pyrus communis]
MSSKTSTRHETVLNVKKYSARGSIRCKAARLEAMLAVWRLLGWRQCSLRDGSACGILHCEYALDVSVRSL